MKKIARAIPFDDLLVKNLGNSEFAVEYLNACLEEGDKELFLDAVRKVVESQGGMTKVAKAAKLNRVSLYKMLHSKGNPGFENILRLLQAIGIRFYVKPKKMTKLKRKAA